MNISQDKWKAPNIIPGEDGWIRWVSKLTMMAMEMDTNRLAQSVSLFPNTSRKAAMICKFYSDNGWIPDRHRFRLAVEWALYKSKVGLSQ